MKEAGGGDAAGLTLVGYDDFNAYTGEGDIVPFSGVRMLDDYTFSVTVKKEETPAPAAPAEPEPPVKKSYRADKGVIQKLSSILVWVVALFLYMVLDEFGIKNLWLLFVVAIPANAIVLLSLRSAWKLYGMNRFLISVIMWGFLLVIYLLLLLTAKVNVWKILPMGLLGQAAIILWFKMFRPVKEDSHE